MINGATKLGLMALKTDTSVLLKAILPIVWSAAQQSAAVSVNKNASKFMV